MLGQRRHPLPPAHAPPHAHRQHIVGVPSAGAPGVGVKLMQEPGFAAHDTHLYTRDYQQPPRHRVEPAAGRPPEGYLAQGLLQGAQGGLGTPLGLRHPAGGVPMAEDDPRRQRALSPGSQHSAAATFFAR
nr:uncharacterized protein LOC123750453 [Procambarus clarkii]